MSQTRMLVVIAGAALSAAAPAFAQTSDSNRAYASELVSDAGARSSFAGDGGAGYDAKGFNISSGDGNNTLYIYGLAQIRYNMDWRTGGDPLVTDGNGFTQGFENTLTRVGFKGNIWDKALTYQVSMQVNSSGDFSLETAFGQYTWENGFGLRFGQFKSPLFRESIVDNQFQLGANRSITNGYFGDTYTQGIQLLYASDSFRFIGGFTDGMGLEGNGSSANTAYNSANETDYSLNARVEWKAMGGGWERFDDFTSWRSAEDMGLLLGVGVNYGSAGADTGNVPDLGSAFTYTADAQLEGKGWNVFGAFYGQYTDPTVGDTFDTFGGVIQGGFFLTDQLEAFARWDGLFFEGNALSATGQSADDAHFISGGLNYYLSPESHAAKFTCDVIWSLNDTSYIFGPNPDPENPDSQAGRLNGQTQYGILGETGNNEVAVILQFQIMF